MYIPDVFHIKDRRAGACPSFSRFWRGCKVAIMHLSAFTGVWSFSHVRHFATSWTVACQAPLSMGLPRRENTGVYCHFLLQRIFFTQGSSNPRLLHWQADSLPCGPPGKFKRGINGLQEASQMVQLANTPPVSAGDPRDASLIPGSGRFLGGESGNPLQ